MDEANLISSLLGVLVGGAITIITQIIIVRTDLKTKQKEARRQYIKEERGKWRENLFETVKDGPKALNLDHVRALLNPYCYYENDSDIMQDGHIWTALKNNDVDLVYKYILLLLKFERERARYENLEKDHDSYYKEARSQYKKQVKKIQSNQRLNF